MKNIGFNIDEREKLKKSVLKSKEYINALNCLNETYKCSNNVEYLDRLLFRIIRSIEDKSYLNQVNIKFLSNNFIKELNNELVRYCANVELVGIILITDTINITDEVILRRPRAED